MTIPLREIELNRFRNYRRKRFEFLSDTVILYGPNGSGKTNLLEAIYYTSLLRSFRGHIRSRELCSWDAADFEIKLTLDTGKYKEKLCIHETRSGRSSWKIGESKVRCASDFINEFRAVSFVPEDRNIISNSSGYRRRFFDILISALDREYLQALICYNRALLQRNAAFKNMRNAVKLFEPELSEQIPVIVSKRREYAEKTVLLFNKLSNDRYHFSIDYEPDYPEDSESFLSHMETIRNREMDRGCTLTGPHRDEFTFKFLDRDLRIYGSTGQVGISALLLKMSEFLLIREGVSLPVVALVDDVTGELDGENLGIFFETLKLADQRFYTFSREGIIPDLFGAQRIDLSRG